MKASKLIKAYLWLEVAFMGYLLFKKPDPGKRGGLEGLSDSLKEKIDAAQDPQAAPPGK